jgi:hypothetical protein
MCVHFIFWSVILIFIELGLFNIFKGIINILRKNRIAPKQDLEFDEDVLEEENRVASIDKE